MGGGGGLRDRNRNRQGQTETEEDRVTDIKRERDIEWGGGGGGGRNDRIIGQSTSDLSKLTMIVRGTNSHMTDIRLRDLIHFDISFKISFLHAITTLYYTSNDLSQTLRHRLYCESVRIWKQKTSRAC